MSDFASLANEFQIACGEKGLDYLARQLGLDTESLRQLYLGWDRNANSFTFPEFDGDGIVIGILRRGKVNGEKKAMQGGRRGIYIPRNFAQMDGPIFLPEGPSDTAALIGIGIAAIGRPSVGGGGDQMASFMQSYRDRDIVVVGDNDAKTNGKWPGKTGAIKFAQFLANELDKDVLWSLPPSKYKDVRAWLTTVQR